MSSLLLLKSMIIADAMKKTKQNRRAKKKPKIQHKEQINPCRTCNSEEGQVPIFDNQESPTLCDEIKYFSGVMVRLHAKQYERDNERGNITKIEKSDNLPKSLCQNCLNLLNGCIMFREMCQATDKALLEAYIKKEPQYKSDDNANCEDSDDSYNVPSLKFSDNSDHEDDTDNLKCESCNNEYATLKLFNGHLRKCKVKLSAVLKQPEKDTKKRFLCDICGKTAYSNASLLVHMGIHENVFPFKCEECPYQGRTMDLLKVHKRTHLPDKPYKCTQCPKATTTSSNLAKHMRHVHSTTRPFKCTYCNKAFSYQHDLKRHVKDIHLRQGTVECDVCFKKFNTKKILQGHRWKIHKIKGDRQGRIPSYLQCQTVDPDPGGTANCEQNCDYQQNKEYPMLT